MTAKSSFLWTMAIGAAVGTVIATLALSAVDKATQAIQNGAQ